MKLQSRFLRFIVYLSAFITVGVMLLIIVYIFINGVPYLTADLFSLDYNSVNASLMPALINTLTVTFFSLLLAVPLGVGAAIFLTEYSKQNSIFVKLIRITTETLSGIPSIVYGLFGYLLFVCTLGFGYSLIAGCLTLSIMILPVIIRTTEVALLAIPASYREGSFALGAGKLRTIMKVVLPASLNGILAGVILSVGRVVGETAALIYTAGTVAQTADLGSSGRTLSVHIYALWNEGLLGGKAYATAVILLLIVIVLNALSAFVAKKLGNKAC